MINSWFSGKAVPPPSHSLPSKNILKVYYSEHFRSAFNTGCSKINQIFPYIRHNSFHVKLRIFIGLYFRYFYLINEDIIQVVLGFLYESEVKT